LQHRDAIGAGCRQAVALVRRLPRRQPHQLVERELAERAARQRQVREVRRIEAAAEEARLAGDGVQDAIQSRGRRKSAYSAASGVPSAGDHW